MTNASPAIPGNISALVALLEQQRALFLQLRTLSDQQGPLVAEAQSEPLLGLLARRQKLIDNVTDVNAKLDPYRQRWDEMLAALAEPDRQRIGDLVKEVQGLLEGILQQDERDRAALQTAKSRIGTEIQTLARSGQAMKAYGAVPRGPVTGIGTGNNRFMNQRG